MVSVSRIRAIDATAVRVPLKRPLVTSIQTIESAPLLLVDVITEDGVVGRTYVFCYVKSIAAAVSAILAEAEEVVRGSPSEPLAVAGKLRERFRLVGMTGAVGIAAAAIDMACWDTVAQHAGLPLVRLLGGSMGRVKAYNSCGLGMSDPAQLAEEALELAEGGFAGVKIRLGRPDFRQDLEAVRAVRGRLPEDVALMADFNQALTLDEALRRGRALDDEGLYWIEEPVRHDDYEACASLTREIKTPIQIGENFLGSRAMQRAISQRACDFMMPDVERIGGVTGWMQAAALAAIHEIPMSSHLMPEFSLHLLAASPTCHWLEYVDWADVIVTEPLKIAGGCAVIPDVSGAGLVWDRAAVSKFRID